MDDAENLARSIAEAVPGGVVHISACGEIRSANREALRLMGMTFEELVERTCAGCVAASIHEDGRPCTKDEHPVMRALATNEPQSMTLGMRRMDGTVLWAVFRATPVADGALVTFLDISDRKRMEEALRQSEERWRVVGQNLPDFVLVVGLDRKILSINRCAPGFREEDVVGTDSIDYVDPAFRDDWVAHFERVAKTGETTRFETHGRGPNGEMRFYETVLSAIREGDRATAIIEVARDITERQTMLRKMAENERLASVGMLAASVAHEINNPLTYILANLECALDPRFVGTPRRESALAEAREGVARVQQIVRDLHSLSRSETDQLLFVDLRRVVETAMRLCGPEVAHRAEVTVDLEEIPNVFASESRLGQVFINLLVNASHAIEHTDPAKRAIAVRTRHDEAAQMVGVEIADTGHGIAKERLQRIFDPFYTTKPNGMGTGLGLSISRDIVEAMGGRIDVRSEVGEGSVFTVWLPTYRAASSS